MVGLRVGLIHEQRSILDFGFGVNDIQPLYFWNLERSFAAVCGNLDYASILSGMLW
jgi:hypothetical protein